MPGQPPAPPAEDAVATRRGGTDRRDTVLRFALLAFMLAWLVVTVVLPLTTLVTRSVTVEVSVAVWGPNEVRVGGRTVTLEDGTLAVGGEPVALEDGAYTAPELHVETAGGVLRRVAVRSIVSHDMPVKVRPIVVEQDGETVRIDGEALPEDGWQRTVVRFAGLKAFRRYLFGGGLRVPLLNSMFVSAMSTLGSVTLAFVYAYTLTRTRVPGRSIFYVVSMLPLFAPTMMFGLSLVYLFGNRGLVTTGLFGALPALAWDIGLYGPVGIIIAEVAFTFPPAVIILSAALMHVDGRLYEAASVLGASPLRTFLTVTVPSVRYALLNAVVVCFTLAFTDFGAPKIVGGGYSVLAVDVYRHVVGQLDFGMGAVVSIVLATPAAIAFVLQRVLERRQAAALSSRSVPASPKPSRLRDGILLLVCCGIAAFILLMVFTAAFASFVRQWPYDLALTLQHYVFDAVGGGGYPALWNSVRVALYSAVLGTALTFTSAYLVVKSSRFPWLRRGVHALGLLPLALPGLVIGIAYIFFFNSPTLPGGFLPNPFNALYGTVAILVLANIAHFFTVGYLIASTALRQIDPEFESVSASLGAPFYRTFLRVTTPICLPAILDIAVYLFVSSMATVSAVIFLYGPDTPLASVAVVSMDDAGDTAAASAMCMLIVATNLAVRGLFEGARALLLRRMQAWRGS